jgi:hypothetical protein
MSLPFPLFSSSFPSPPFSFSLLPSPIISSSLSSLHFVPCLFPSPFSSSSFPSPPFLSYRFRPVPHYFLIPSPLFFISLPSRLFFLILSLLPSLFYLIPLSISVYLFPPPFSSLSFPFSVYLITPCLPYLFPSPLFAECKAGSVFLTFLSDGNLKSGNLSENPTFCLDKSQKFPKRQHISISSRIYYQHFLGPWNTHEGSK